MINNNPNNYVGYGVDPYGGQQYPSVAQAKFSQPLTAQDMAELQNKSEKFSLSIDPIDLKRSYCTHKRGHEIVLKPNDDGTFTCAICGETFNLVEANEESIKEAIGSVKDILQSIKTYYLDIPEESTIEFFPILALLDKVPKFYQQAVNNFNKYNGAGFNMNNNPYQQTWNLFSAVVGPNAAAPIPGYNPMGGGMGYPQQQMGGYVPQAGSQMPFAGGYQQPMYNNMAPGVNPFYMNGNPNANMMPGAGNVNMPQAPANDTNTGASPVASAQDATPVGGEQIVNTKTYSV